MELHFEYLEYAPIVPKKAWIGGYEFATVFQSGRGEDGLLIKILPYGTNEFVYGVDAIDKAKAYIQKEYEQFIKKLEGKEDKAF